MPIPERKSDINSTSILKKHCRVLIFGYGALPQHEESDLEGPDHVASMKSWWKALLTRFPRVPLQLQIPRSHRAHLFAELALGEPPASTNSKVRTCGSHEQTSGFKANAKQRHKAQQHYAHTADNE